MLDLKLQEYLKKIELEFQQYYDIKEPPDYLPFNVDIYAAFFQRNEKYFGSKKVNLWRLTTNEHIFLKSYNQLNLQEVELMVDTLKKSIEVLIEPSSEHMKTYITGVFIIEKNNNLSLELIEYINKFKFSKVFKFYLHGWCDLRLILIDLSSSKVYTSREGREVKNFYQRLLED